MFHPNLGRFLQEDPKGFDAGDVNFYRYVGNNPIVWTDPTGLDRFLVGGGEVWDPSQHSSVVVDRWERVKGQWKLIGRYQYDISETTTRKNGGECCTNSLGGWISYTGVGFSFIHVRQRDRVKIDEGYFVGRIKSTPEQDMELIRLLDKERNDRDTLFHAWVRNCHTWSQNRVNWGADAGGTRPPNYDELEGAAGLSPIGKPYKTLPVPPLLPGPQQPALIIGCFVAGTPVQTALGIKPIENVQLGDAVITWNEVSQSFEERSVSGLIRSTKCELMSVAGDGWEAVCSLEHPFLLSDDRWQMASELRVGMRLKSKEFSPCVVRSVRHLQSLPITPVYNFHVEVTQTYCVGRQGIVVHNKPV